MKFNQNNWPSPSEELQDSPEFKAIWDTIKRWDICVPDVDGEGSYSGGTGSHVAALLLSLNPPQECVETCSHCTPPPPDNKEYLDG
jgi:hypothetical protein